MLQSHVRLKAGTGGASKKLLVRVLPTVRVVVRMGRPGPEPMHQRGHGNRNGNSHSDAGQYTIVEMGGKVLVGSHQTAINGQLGRRMFMPCTRLIGGEDWRVGAMRALHEHVLGPLGVLPSAGGWVRG
jgi:hypothetical protein